MERPKSPGQRLIDRMYLLPGRKIKLIKIESGEDLSKRSGLVIEGVLDNAVEIDKPISLSGETRDIGIVNAVRYGEEGFFFRTDSGVYELVNTDQFRIPEENKSEEYKVVENKIEEALKLAQKNAIDMVEIGRLIEERRRLQNQPQTKEIAKRILEIDESIEKYTVKVNTISEFKILMEKTGRLDYSVMGSVEHENAHSNKAGSLGVGEGGYMLIVGKDDKGFLYQPVAVRGEFPVGWTREEIIKSSIEMANAPKEYGNINSPGDNEQIETLRRQLKNNY